MMPQSLVRLFRAGMRDADARIANALAPRPLTAVDRYLASSIVIRTVDGVLQRCPQVWARSFTHRRLIAPLMARTWRWIDLYELLGWTLLVSSGTHVALAITQEPPPGWYWTVIPVMAAGFGALLLAASRAGSRV